MANDRNRETRGRWRAPPLTEMNSPAYSITSSKRREAPARPSASDDGCRHYFEGSPILEEQLAENGLVFGHTSFLQQEAEADSGEQPEDKLVGDSNMVAALLAEEQERRGDRCDKC